MGKGRPDPTDTRVTNELPRTGEREKEKERKGIFRVSLNHFDFFAPLDRIGHAIKEGKQQLSLFLSSSVGSIAALRTLPFTIPLPLSLSNSSFRDFRAITRKMRERERERQLLSSLIATGQNKTGKVTSFLLVW